MKRLATTFLLVFLTWLILTFSLSAESLAVGMAVSLVITVICRHLLARETPRVIMHPKIWGAFLVYIGMMLYVEALAHWDVAKRIISGKIRPAIVGVPVGFRTPLGKTLLGNSITLTPGTLTINSEGKRVFYVHTIAYRKDHGIGRVLSRFGSRVIS